MRGAPHSGFATLISRMSRTSSGVLGRPPRGLDFQRHQARNPARCHQMMVSGLRIFTAFNTLGSQVIEPRKHQTIDIADGHPLGRPTLQHIELMPKGENFGLQGCARPEQPGRGVPRPARFFGRGASSELCRTGCSYGAAASFAPWSARCPVASPLPTI
jgi:hypothetical protein